jgi:outer membrane lipoprotein-sorting protein
LLLFSVSLLSGCASLWPRRVPREILSSSDLLQRIQARNRRIHSIRAQAKVTINLGKNRFTLEELIIVKKPASLRVEAFSPIGQTLLYLTTDGEVFEALVPAENRLYRGVATAKNLSPFFSFPAEARKLIPLMVGELGWSDDERFAAYYSQKDKAYIVKEDTPEGSRRIFWIDPLHFAPLRATELDKLRNPRWEVLFANFRKRNGIHFPMDIEFRIPPAERRIRMRLLEWEINPSLGEGTFRLDVPKGVEIIDMK